MEPNKIPTPAPSETGATAEERKSLSDYPADTVHEWLKADSCLYWAEKEKIKTEKGTALDFQSHRFLKDIFEDWTPVQVARKCSQVGFSTMVILKTMWAVKHKNWNVIYTLPTSADASEFVKTKVNNIINRNKQLRDWTKDADSVQVKKVGDQFIYYRGTFSNKPEDEKTKTAVATMFTSDLNVHDEADRSDQTIIDQYKSRLANSEYKGRWLFSNPSSFDTNSEMLWADSDQKHWFIRCEHCGKRQYLAWPESIHEGQFVCTKCGGILSNSERANGEWVRKFNNREVSGYWINHLMCPWITAKEIVEASKGDQFLFHNFVLGLPYSGTGIAINESLILKNLAEGKPTGRMTIGVDVGILKHYVVGNHEGVVKVGTFEEWEDLELLMQTYDAEIVIIDSKPDITKPRELVKKYPGRVWLTWFKREINKTDFVQWDEKTKTVVADRSKIIGEVINDLVESHTRYYVSRYDLDLYLTHFKTIKKVRETDRMGNLQELWTTASDEDHFVFAHCYYKIGLMKRGMDRKETGLKAASSENPDHLPKNVFDIQQYVKENQQLQKRHGDLL